MLRRLWLNSQTKLLAYLQLSSASLLGLLDSAQYVVTSQQFKDLLGTLTLPHWVPIALAGLALVTYLAHGHGKD